MEVSNNYVHFVYFQTFRTTTLLTQLYRMVVILLTRRTALFH